MTLEWSDDLFVRTARQREFFQQAAVLADEFAPRAAEHDENNTFPYENFESLRRSGYLQMTVPQHYGGDGGSVTEMVLAQERLARGDASTALGVGWHLSVVGTLAETGGWPEEIYQSICRAVVERGALINIIATEPATGSPSRGGRPTTTASRQSTGEWVLNGRKSFATLSLILDFHIITAGIEGESGAGAFLVPGDTPGLSVLETWNTMGMRASGSHDVVLEEVRLPENALLVYSREGKVTPRGVGGEGWSLHIPAVYVGIAQAALAKAAEFADAHRPNSLKGRPIADVPHIQEHLGKMHLDLLTIQSLLLTAAERWDTEPDKRPQLVPLLGAAKYRATNTAVEIVDRAMRVVGGLSLAKKFPLERYYRDVRAGLHNPPMDDVAITQLARRVLE